MDGTKALHPLSIDCFRAAEREFFCFLNALAQLLLTALKLTDWMIFYSDRKKAPHQSADLKKITWNTYFLGATE